MTDTYEIDGTVIPATCDFCNRPAAVLWDGHAWCAFEAWAFLADIPGHFYASAATFAAAGLWSQHATVLELAYGSGKATARAKLREAMDTPPENG